MKEILLGRIGYPGISTSAPCVRISFSSSRQRCYRNEAVGLTFCQTGIQEVSFLRLFVKYFGATSRVPSHNLIDSNDSSLGVWLQLEEVNETSLDG